MPEVPEFHEVRNVPLLIQNEECVREMGSFNWDPPPLCLPDTDIIHVIKWTRLLLCFFVLQAIKNWMMGRPGNEAKTLQEKKGFKLVSLVEDPFPPLST